MSATIDVRVINDTVTGALARLNKQGGDLRPFFAAVGNAWIERIAVGFAESRAPDGAAWKPLKYRKGQPLLDTGRLRNSFATRIGDKSVVVGTNVVYARVHNEGGTIDRAPHSTRVRLRKQKGGALLRQPGHPNLAVFATDSHTRVRTTWHAVAGYQIRIPARPFLPVRELPRAWEDDVYRAFVAHMQKAGVPV